jgi:hypothetical protein
MNTPWGQSDSAKQIAPGVWDVTTPGHGGVMVEHDVGMKQLSQSALKLGEIFCHRNDHWVCFEEDCAWAAPAYEHPEWFDHIFVKEFDPDTYAVRSYKTVEEVKEFAEHALRLAYPQYFEQESYQARKLRHFEQLQMESAAILVHLAVLSVKC